MNKKTIFGFTLIRTRLCRNLVNVRGFTLIELLVVIAIIGVLATLVMANMGGVRARARDAQRKSDINQIQKALEMYKNAQSTPSYPATYAGLTSTYIQKLPHDPLYDSTCTTGCWTDYAYTRDTTDVLKYTIIACLENASDQQRDTGTGYPVGGCTTSYSRSEP